MAVLGACIFPSVGHAYAGDWVRGIPFLVLNVGLPFFMAGPTAGAITGTYVVSRLWEYVDAYSTAEDSNLKLVSNIESSKVTLLTASQTLAPKSLSSTPLVSPVTNEKIMEKLNLLENKFNQLSVSASNKADKKGLKK